MASAKTYTASTIGYEETQEQLMTYAENVRKLQKVTILNHRYV